MNRISRRLSGWPAGAGALALLLGAAPASAATLGPPNFCLTGSTQFSCLMQLDMLNTPSGTIPNYQPLGYVDIVVATTADPHTLEITIDAGKIGDITYNFGTLDFNIVDPSHASVSDIHFTTVGGSSSDTKSYKPLLYTAGPVTGGSSPSAVPRELPPGSNQWINTDCIWSGGAPVKPGLFTEIRMGNTQPGDLLVYPHNAHGEHGHVGIVLLCSAGRPVTGLSLMRLAAE